MKSSKPFRKYPKSLDFDHSSYRLFERIPAVPGTLKNQGLTVFFDIILIFILVKVILFYTCKSSLGGPLIQLDTEIDLICSLSVSQLMTFLEQKYRSVSIKQNFAADNIFKYCRPFREQNKH